MVRAKIRDYGVSLWKYGQTVCTLKIILYRYKLSVFRRGLQSDTCSLYSNQMLERQVASPGEYHPMTIRSFCVILASVPTYLMSSADRGCSFDHGSSWHPLHHWTDIFHTKQTI